jgi:hypothetical protein
MIAISAADITAVGKWGLGCIVRMFVTSQALSIDGAHSPTATAFAGCPALWTRCHRSLAIVTKATTGFVENQRVYRQRGSSACRRRALLECIGSPIDNAEEMLSPGIADKARHLHSLIYKHERGRRDDGLAQCDARGRIPDFNKP